jgi:hypothetical protein
MLPTPLAVKPYRLDGRAGFRTYLGALPLSRKPVPLERASQQKHAVKTALLSGAAAEEVRRYPLSEEDAHTIIPTLRIMSYPDLLRYDNIHDALDEKGRLLILYLTQDEKTGHWVCLLRRQAKNGETYLEYFDPYGRLKPDQESKWLRPEKLREFGQDTKHLTQLLADSGLRVTYSKVPFQTDTRDVNTCGRHCLTRLYCKHLSLPEYTQMIMNTGMNPDDFVSAFTYTLIGK